MEPSASASLNAQRDRTLLHLDAVNRQLREQLRQTEADRVAISAKAVEVTLQEEKLQRREALLNSRQELLLERALAHWTRLASWHLFDAWRRAAEVTRSTASALARMHRHNQQRAVVFAWRDWVCVRQQWARAALWVVALRRRHSLCLAFEAWFAYCISRRRHRKALAIARRQHLRRLFVCWRVATSLELSRRWAVKHDADVRALEAARSDVEEVQQKLASSQLLAAELARQRDAAYGALLRAELRSPALPSSPFLDVSMRFSMVLPGGFSSLSQRGGALCPAAHASLTVDGTHEDIVMLVASPVARPAVAVLRTPLGVDVDLNVAGDTQREWLPCVIRDGVQPPLCSEWAACGLGTLGLLCFGGFDGVKELDACYLLVRDSETSAAAATPDAGAMQHFHWVGPLAALSGAPGPRSHATLTAAPGGSLAYLFGGHSSTRGALNELWCVAFSKAGDTGVDSAPVGLTWYRPQTGGQPPSPRTGHAACVSPHDGCLYVFGGLGTGAYTGTRVLNDLHRFDPTSGAWECIRPWGPQPPPRRLHAMCAVGAHLVIVGGTTDGDSVETAFDSDCSDCYALDLVAMTWRKLTLVGSSQGVKPPSRSAHALVATADGALLALGGVVDGRLAHDFAPCCIENAAAAEGLALRREVLIATKVAASSSAARRDAIASAAAALAHAAAARREALHARADADDAHVRRQAAADAMHALATRVRMERQRRKRCEADAQQTRQQLIVLEKELQRRTAALESAVAASDAEAKALAEALSAT